MQRHKVLFLTTAFILLISQGARARSRYEYPFSQNLKIEPGTEVIIKNVTGDIRVSQGFPGQLIIGGKKVIKAPSERSAEKEAERVKVEVKREKGKIRIWVKDGRRGDRVFFGFWRKVSSWIDFDIRIPPGTDLEVSSTSGDIRAKGVKGRITIKTTSGNLCLQGFVGPTNVHTTSGDVSLKGIVGRVNMEGTSSDLELSGIKGDVDITVTSGDIDGRDIEGNLTVEGTSGDMEITRLRGNLLASLHSGEVKADVTQGGVRVETTSGDIYIRASLQEGKDYRVDTSSGDVVFKIKEGIPFNLVIDTSSGKITAKVPLIINSISRNHLEGWVGKGGPTLRITTSSGDIELSQ